MCVWVFAWVRVCTDVFGAHGVRPPQLRDKLLGVQADLDDVVEQGEQGSQGEGGHEQRHEPKLDYCRKTHTHTPR